MIVVYTGKGKGKTCACVGQLLRAKGQGLRVAFAQFIKRDKQAGEQKELAHLLGTNFLAGGAGFTSNGDLQLHRTATLHVLKWGQQKLFSTDLLVFDEILYALQRQLLWQNEIEEIISVARAEQTHLVLSGRVLPTWLADLADLVSEIQDIKHPYHSGQKALPGIEF